MFTRFVLNLRLIGRFMFLVLTLNSIPIQNILQVQRFSRTYNKKKQNNEKEKKNPSTNLMSLYLRGQY